MFITNASANDAIKPKEMQWMFDGITGKFDYEAIQRGFKVYKEVCQHVTQ